MSDCLINQPTYILLFLSLWRSWLNRKVKISRDTEVKGSNLAEI